MKKTTGSSNRLSLLESYESDLRRLLSSHEQADLFLRPPQPGSPEDAARHLADGRYLLKVSQVEFQRDACHKFAYDLLPFLCKHIPDEAEGFTFVKETFISSEMTCPEFLSLVFRNQEAEIMRLARHYGLRSDLVAFFAVYFARPFRAAAARILRQGIDLSQWKRGYCPIGGHWPALSHLNTESDVRHLWCRHCDTTWAYQREQCPFCGSARYRTVEIFAPGAEEPYRAQACNECRRYVKEMRTDLDVSSFPFDAAYYQTLALDTAMQQEGYLLDSPLLLSEEVQHGVPEAA